MQVVLKLDLPDALAEELQSAAKGSGIAAHAWAALAVEAELAARRLSRVALGAYGPRMVTRAASEATEPDGYRVHYPERSCFSD
jgi:hypothetical protein